MTCMTLFMKVKVRIMERHWWSSIRTRTSQFGPSVLAPFSKVIVLGDAGYVDGFIVGKTVHTSGPNASGLQFHGDGYTGPLKCR